MLDSPITIVASLTDHIMRREKPAAIRLPIKLAMVAVVGVSTLACSGSSPACPGTDAGRGGGGGGDPHCSSGSSEGGASA